MAGRRRGELTVRVGANTKPYKDEVNKLKKFSKGAGKGIASGLKFAALGVGAVGAAFGAVAISGIQDFTKLDKKVREVGTLLGDVNDADLSKLTQQIENVATATGQAAEDVATSFYDSISAGIPQEKVEAFVQDAAKFATAGGTEIGAATDLLTSAINAYGLEAEDATKVSDTLFGAVKAGKTTVDEIASSFSNMGPIAAASGVEIDELAGWMAQLTLTGTPTSVATTQIRAAITELSKAGTNVSDRFKILAGQTFPDFLKSGGSVEDAMKLISDSVLQGSSDMLELVSSENEIAAAFRQLSGKTTQEFLASGGKVSDIFHQMADAASGPDQSVGEAIHEMIQTSEVFGKEFKKVAGQSIKDFLEMGGTAEEALGEMAHASTVTSGSVLDLFGSVEAGQAVLGITGANAEAFSDTLATVQDSAGSTDQAFETMAGSVEFQQKKLKEQFGAIKRDIGEAFIPVLMKAMAFVSDTVVPLIGKYWPIALQAAKDKITELKPTVIEIKNRVVDFWKTAIQPVIDIIQKWVSELKGVDSALKVTAIVLAAATVAVVIATAAVAALSAALAVLFSPITLVIGAIALLTAGVILLYNNWTPFQVFVDDKLVPAMKAIWATLSVGIEALTEFASNWRETWDGIWEGLKGIVNSIIGGIEAIPNAFIGGMNRMIHAWNRFSFSSPEVKVLDKVVVPSFSFKTQDISPFKPVLLPRLASGGIVTAPTVALIGESGPEAVVPLGRGGGYGGITLHFHGDIYAGSSEELADTVIRSLEQWRRRNGRLPAALTGA